MTIEQKLAAIAAEEEFSSYPFIFDNLYRIDERVNHSDLPCIVSTLPASGSVTFRNGRYYDSENILLGFFDAVPHDANGEDNAEVYNRMKVLAIRFVTRMNESGLFGKTDTMQYDVRVEQFSDIITGVTIAMSVENVGQCLEVNNG